MFAEIALYLATPASRSVRRHGFLNAAVSMWSQSARCRKTWAPHLERCRAAVLAAVDELPRRRTVVVLGSGLLQDVPIEVLVKRFGKVILVDAVHLASVRARVFLHRWSGVSFVTRDLSGYDEMLLSRRVAATTGDVSVIARLDPLGFIRRIPDVDLVVSANLLSQMGVGINDRLARPDGGARLMPEDAPEKLIATHLRSLAGLGVPTVVVSDVRYELRDRTGRVIEGFDLMQGARLPEAKAVWEWTVAPFGEEAQDVERVHLVKVFTDLDGKGRR